MKSEIRYLNTDLDLTAGRDLSPLATVLQARGVYALSVIRGEDARWHATFETAKCFQTPEESMSVLLDAVESLSGDARNLWSECRSREFNIGYDCGDHPWAFNNGLSNSVLARAAAAGATLRITLYPPDDTPVDGSE